jgi:CubicO group peptidase (beta-lactamase class C family)
VGLNSTKLARITDWQRGLVDDDGLLPMAATLVARRGAVAYWEQCGEQNPGVPLAADTIYRIYSMGKPVTSVALLQLYEQGRFLLTDPLKLHLPLFDKKHLRVMVDGNPEKTEPCKTNITIAQLLTHTAGLTYDHHMMNGGREWPGKGVSMTEWYEELASRPLAYQPGTQWMYSLATDVCGILIEVLSGLTFEQYLQEHLFGPLGMTDTGFRVTDEMRPRFATNWVDGRDPALVERDGLLPYVKPLPDGVPDMSPGMASPDEPYDDGYHARIFSGGGGMVGKFTRI